MAGIALPNSGVDADDLTALSFRQVSGEWLVLRNVAAMMTVRRRRAGSYDFRYN